MNKTTVIKAGKTLFKVFIVNGAMLGGMAYGKQFLTNKEREFTKEGLEVLTQLGREVINDSRTKKGKIWKGKLW